MTEPARLTSHTADTTVAADGLARIVTQLRDKPAFRALLSTYLDEVQVAETAAWGLYALTIDGSDGDALDQLGALLSQPRPPGLSDAVFRRVLHGCVAALHASGRGDALIRVALALVGSSAFTLRESFPATVVLEPTAATGIPVAVMRATLAHAKAAGVGLQVIDVPSGSAFSFAPTMFLSKSTTPDEGFSDETQVTGGKLVGVM